MNRFLYLCCSGTSNSSGMVNKTFSVCFLLRLAGRLKYVSLTRWIHYASEVPVMTLCSSGQDKISCLETVCIGRHAHRAQWKCFVTHFLLILMSAEFFFQSHNLKTLQHMYIPFRLQIWHASPWAVGLVCDCGCASCFFFFLFSICV